MGGSYSNVLPQARPLLRRYYRSACRGQSEDRLKIAVRRENVEGDRICLKKSERVLDKQSIRWLTGRGSQDHSGVNQSLAQSRKLSRQSDLKAKDLS